MVKVLIQEDPVVEISNASGKDKSKSHYGAGKKLYQCEACGFHYTEKEQAEKCEAWCKEHNSCNLEITAQAEENKTK